MTNETTSSSFSGVLEKKALEAEQLETNHVGITDPVPVRKKQRKTKTKKKKKKKGEKLSRRSTTNEETSDSQPAGSALPYPAFLPNYPNGRATVPGAMHVNPRGTNHSQTRHEDDEDSNTVEATDSGHTNPDSNDLILHAELVDEAAIRRRALEETVQARAEILEEPDDEEENDSDTDDSPKKSRRWMLLCCCFPCTQMSKFQQIMASVFCCIAIATVVAVTVVVVNPNDPNPSSNIPTMSPSASTESQSSPTLAPLTNDFDLDLNYTGILLDGRNHNPPVPANAVGKDSNFGNRIAIGLLSESPDTYLVVSSYGSGSQTYETTENRQLLRSERNLATFLQQNKLVAYVCVEGEDTCQDGSYISGSYDEPWTDFALSQNGARLAVLVDSRLFLYDFPRRSVPITDANKDISLVYTLPAEIILPMTPESMSVNVAGDHVALIDSEFVRTFTLDDASADTQTNLGADSYTSGWNGQSINEALVWRKLVNQDTIVAVDMDTTFVAVGNNLDVEDEGCEECRTESLFFDGYGIRVFDVVARQQVGPTIGDPDPALQGNGWSVRKNGVKIAGGGRILAVASVFGDKSNVFLSDKRDHLCRVNVYHLTEDQQGNNKRWEPLGIGVWEATGTDFGASVSLREDGKVLAISAPMEEIESLEDGWNRRGRVYVYSLVANDEWKLLEEDAKPVFAQESIDIFGGSTALSPDGKLLAIGSAFANIDGQNTGAVHVFHQDPPVQD